MQVSEVARGVVYLIILSHGASYMYAVLAIIHIACYSVKVCKWM